MDDYLYLLWAPNAGWGVFDISNCPDVEGFPNWMYKIYKFPVEQYNQVFRRLIDVKENLDMNKVIPTKGREKDIFPELSDLLRD